MSFCTAINCMDGRVQLPVISYLRDKLRADHVDMITEASPVAFLAKGKTAETEHIRRKVGISLKAHESKFIAVVAHHDCAGNRVSDADQQSQLEEAVDTLAKLYPRLTIAGLWIDSLWRVSERLKRLPSSDG